MEARVGSVALLPICMPGMCFRTLYAKQSMIAGVYRRTVSKNKFEGEMRLHSQGRLILGRGNLYAGIWLIHPMGSCM
jgi:hypothetical protein